jgi:hypothetical protein
VGESFKEMGISPEDGDERESAGRIDRTKASDMGSKRDRWNET